MVFGVWGYMKLLVYADAINNRTIMAENYKFRKIIEKKKMIKYSDHLI